MNKSGKVFGIMDNKGIEQSIWAEIVVGITYDFDANMCSATWKTPAGILPCPGTKEIQEDLSFSIPLQPLKAE